MVQNLEETTPNSDNAEAAPVRRRASRRVTATAGAAGDATVTKTEASAAEASAAEAPVAEAPTAPKRATRSRKKVEPAAEAAEQTPAQAETAQVVAAVQASETPSEAPTAPKRATRSRKKVDPDAEVAAAADARATEAQPAADQSADAQPTTAKRTSSRRTSSKRAESKSDESKQEDAKSAEASDSSAAAATDAASSDAPADEPTNGRRSRRRSNSADKGADRSEKNDTHDRSDANDSSEQSDDSANSSQGDDNRSRGRGKQDNNKSDDKQENGSRSSRTRQRDRKRRGGDEHEVEIAEDDVLLPIAGILDVLDNYAFVRTSGYLPGVSDVYVALGQVKKYSLRRGDAVVGAIRQPREGDGGGRQKYNAIVKIDSINGKPVEESEKRPDVAEMTAIFPQQPLRFAGAAGGLGREIDKHAPMGLGQRALVTLPAHISSTRVLTELAAAVTASAPEVHLLVVATNARPEEATHLQRTVSGEVVTATFDRPAEDQVTIAELAIDRARRLAELGHDVVVLFHSLSDLAQAYEQHLQGGRVTPDAAKAQAIAQVKHLLAAARNLENGGSLTLVATARTKSGVALDKELLREVRPVANCIVKISGSNNAPEVDAEKSSTITF